MAKKSTPKPAETIVNEAVNENRHLAEPTIQQEGAAETIQSHEKSSSKAVIDGWWVGRFGKHRELICCETEQEARDAMLAYHRGCESVEPLTVFPRSGNDCLYFEPHWVDDSLQQTVMRGPVHGRPTWKR